MQNTGNTSTSTSTCTNSSSGKRQQQLILLAVVECQYFTNNGIGASDTKLHKVRIYRHDLIEHYSNGGDDIGDVDGDGKDIVCTGQYLHEAILKQCQISNKNQEQKDDEQNKDEIMDYGGTNNVNSSICSSIEIEIYNPKKCQFESLLDSNIENCNIVVNYGNRVRCILNCNTSISTSAVGADNGCDENVDDKSNNNLLQIMGRHFPYDPNGMDFAGGKLIVKEMVNNKIDGTGLNVWDGALLLALYLEKVPEKVKSKSVLELGAGTGFVGIAAAFLSPIKIILTDLEYTVKLINDNISLNKGAISHNQEKRHDNNEDNNENQKIIQCNCECQVCDWFDPPPVKMFGFMNFYPEIILIADCVWVEELVDPLMNTLEGYCNDVTTVVITYQQRGKVAHEKFWNRLRNMFDVIDSVDTESMCGLKKPNKISLIECSGFIRVPNMGLGLDKE